MKVNSFEKFSFSLNKDLLFFFQQKSPICSCCKSVVEKI